jgi:purine-binding chemotaxis protein CheW
VSEQPAEAAQAPEIAAVVVRLGVGRFAVALESVAEVGNLPRVTRVPGAPVWLAGVANWRGRILPVLDLRDLLGGTADRPGPSARLVVVAIDGITLGLVVDAVEGTETLGAVDEFPAVLAGPAAGLVAGQVPREDGPIALLETAALIRLRDALPRGRRSA